MKVRLLFAFMLALVLLVPSMYAADLSSADEPEEDVPDVNGMMTDQILSGIDAVSDSVSRRADSLILPPGTTACS